MQHERVGKPIKLEKTYNKGEVKCNTGFPRFRDLKIGSKIISLLVIIGKGRIDHKEYGLRGKRGLQESNMREIRLQKVKNEVIRA